jgi:hypothetical protein
MMQLSSVNLGIVLSSAKTKEEIVSSVQISRVLNLYQKKKIFVLTSLCCLLICLSV